MVGCHQNTVRERFRVGATQGGRTLQDSFCATWFSFLFLPSAVRFDRTFLPMEGAGWTKTELNEDDQYG